MNRLLILLLSDLAGMRHTLYTWLLPFGLLLDALAGGSAARCALGLCGFLLLSLLPFLALVWAIGTQYKKILSSLAGRMLRSDYKLRGVKTSGMFAALFAKECRRFFGTTIYVMNTGIGAVMLVGMAVYALVMRGQALPALAALGGVQKALPVTALMLCSVQAMINPACVSISLEGKTLWILKEAPVPPRVLFGAKALLNVLVSAVPAAVSVVLLWAGYAPDAVDALGLLVLCICFGLFTPVYGLTVNLLLPRMDCDNDTIIVKQSAASAVGIFGGILAVGLGALLWTVCGRMLSFAGFCVLAAALLLLCAAALWRWVCGHGAKILQTL